MSDIHFFGFGSTAFRSRAAPPVELFHKSTHARLCVLLRFQSILARSSLFLDNQMTLNATSFGFAKVPIIGNRSIQRPRNQLIVIVDNFKYKPTAS